MAVQPIRILVVTVLIGTIRCQDGFDRDLIRLHQLATNDGQIETITSYSTNIIQREPSQSINSVSVQYHLADDSESADYNRADRGRSRKVYRIKNPFQQRQLGEENKQDVSNPAQRDSENGASNQYAAMQYSLPPEEFLQQMRAENQYYQQQQQGSTPAPALSYTATPQPPYQYSTAAPNYDNNNQQQTQQLDQKLANGQTYRSLSNLYQFSGQNAYPAESVQSTPSPVNPSWSTAQSNVQFVGTPASTYVSSSSPLFLSSPSNLQSFLSSSMSAIQAGTPDYNNKITSTIGSNSINYGDINENKKIQIDHYDNSANGVRYPINVQQQYQSDYPTSTPAPTTTAYPDQMRESWQNAMNEAMSQYQKYPNNNRNLQDGRSDLTPEGTSDTHRVGNMPAANNMYLSYVQPDYQVLSNLRSRSRDVEQDTAQAEYSHGDYGWRMNEQKKPSPPSLPSPSFYSSGYGHYPKYQAFTSQPDPGVAVSQMSFHMDTGRSQSYEPISKSSPETDPQEFAKAAAKAHENQKRQQQLYAALNFNNPLSNSPSLSSFFSNDKQRSPFFYNNNPQQELITVSPFHYLHARDNSFDEKYKQPTSHFDHDKALKNIVPIDVSNVVGSENQQKPTVIDPSRYNLPNIGKEEQSLNKPPFRAITDSFYQDKNSMYGFNIKPKPEEVTTIDATEFFAKQQNQDQIFNPSTYATENKRYIEGQAQQGNFIQKTPNNYGDSVQSSANLQQQGVLRPQQQQQPQQSQQHPTDISSIMKLNDIPYRLTQGMPADTFRLNNNNFEPAGLPTPLPIRLNQNVGTHQIDVASSILSKFLANKQPMVNLNRPELETQPANYVSTINGFKVANPFNVDLNVVADMLKGKPAILDDSQLIGMRDQFNKPSPLKLDISQLQQLLLKNENVNLGLLNDGMSIYNSPYMEIYNSGRYPYQGVKYSRSQEEEESIIPIADASSTHPIGAVIDDDILSSHEETDVTAQDSDGIPASGPNTEDHKTQIIPGYRGKDRHRHPNSIMPGRRPYSRKYPKGDIREPYPLLKPPPLQMSRSRGLSSRPERPSRRRRVRRPKMVRVLKTEPLFEAGSEDNEETDVPILLKPPPPVAEAKSDVVEEEKSS